MSMRSCEFTPRRLRDHGQPHHKRHTDFQHRICYTSTLVRHSLGKCRSGAPPQSGPRQAERSIATSFKPSHHIQIPQTIHLPHLSRNTFLALQNYSDAVTVGPKFCAISSRSVSDHGHSHWKYGHVGTLRLTCELSFALS